MARLPASLQALFLALALLSPAAAAAERHYRPLDVAGVKAGRYQNGEKHRITGKYRELIHREIRLYDLDVRFVLGLPNLSRQLFEFKAQKDNLTLYGFFRAPKEEEGTDEGLPIFEVERIEAAPEDHRLFEERLAELLGSKKATVESILALTGEMGAALKRSGDPALREVARRAFTEVLGRGEAELAAEDAEGRIALLRRLHEAVGDPETTVEHLRTLARRFPGHAAILELLKELRCTQLEGEWLTYPEFKRKLGFVQRGDRWVKPTRKELLDTVQALQGQNQTNFILRHRTDREYKLLAQSGKVEKGMTREELAEALGLPDRVEREVREGAEFDQWNYGDRRIYLFNGQVAAFTR